jgi:hypothetical protein
VIVFGRLFLFSFTIRGGLRRRLRRLRRALRRGRLRRGRLRRGRLSDQLIEIVIEGANKQRRRFGATESRPLNPVRKSQAVRTVVGFLVFFGRGRVQVGHSLSKTREGMRAKQLQDALLSQCRFQQ